MNIDWSEAPEWASVRLNHKVFNEWCWASAHEDDAIASRGDGARDFKLMANFWRVIAERPATWIGQGLPPAGTVCEWFSPIYGWLGGKVVGHDGTVTVISHNDGYTGCHPHEVRPIPTPEQLAAEAREKAIDHACKKVEGKVEKYNVRLDCSVAIRATVEAMIDEGYRLTTQEGEE